MIRLAVVALVAFVALATAGGATGWVLGTLAYIALADSWAAWVRAVIGFAAVLVAVVTIGNATERKRP